MSKIPAPPGAAPLTSTENTLGSKRRLSGQGAAGPPSKRAGGAAPAASKASAATTGALDCEAWDTVAAEQGWTLDDCLSYKLSFKKKDDPKVKQEAMAAHMRRLRAAGRHLLDLTRSQESDLEALMTDLVQEEKVRDADRAAHEAALAELRSQLTAAQAKLEEQAAAAAAQAAAAAEAREQLGTAAAELQSAHDAVAASRQEASQAQEQLAETRKQVASLDELHGQAQRYNGQLQEYNAKLQGELRDAQAAASALGAARDALAEEAAGLRGQLSAAQAEARSAQAANTATEAARDAAAGDAARLRGELAVTGAARDAALADLTAARSQASALREASGKTAEVLAAEQAATAILTAQGQAQAAEVASLQAELAGLRTAKAAADSLGEGRGRQAADLGTQLAEANAALEVARGRIGELERVRRSLHNTVLELKGNIRVFCRVRPASGGENGETACELPASSDGRGLELTVPSAAERPGSGERYSFAFDRVFGPSASQEEVFEEISQLVQSALDGYRVCIFAYGATGSGKTHTMLGSPAQHGMIPRAMAQLFAASAELEAAGWAFDMKLFAAPAESEAAGWAFDMKASMLECYNEEYRDLLGKGPPAGKKHSVSHDERGGTSVSYIEAVDVRRPDRVAQLLERAMRQRAVGATAANEHSSRSHMVFMLAITGRHAASGQTVSGALNLIDLAGSERLSRSLAVGDRLKETQNINKSLSALGDVIMALANREAHIPYRNSKLTWLLQPALGGDAKTLMFVNVAPTPVAAPESLCSLRFASKVNACEVGTARRTAGASK